MAVPTVTSLDLREMELAPAGRTAAPPPEAPLAERVHDRAGAASAGGAGGVSLGATLVLGFGLPLALLAVMTAVAAASTQGTARVLVLAGGGIALVVGIAAARWLAGRIVQPVGEALAIATKLNAGDLTGRIDARGSGEIGRLMRALQEMHARMFRIVSEVRNGTTTVASTSSQISRDNEALSDRTETQVNSLQDTAASMEELTAAVRQNADNAQQANALVLSASERAAQGGALMNEVVHTMGSIRDSSRSIVEIISVIDGIAFQTNILALNAAVEAARAGDQGRGFAVVASEVRTLAQRCAQAAKEIKGLIGTSVEKVDAGGKLVDDAGRKMGEIVDSVRQVANLMSQINTGSREQSVGIESINQAIAKIERTTQNNASLVEGARKTAVTLNEQAVALMQAVAGFNLGDREHGNADEAMAMVKRAAEFARQHGREALVADINKLGKGQFVDRDLYLMVIDDDITFIAHGNNPRTLGQGPKSKDVDGKAFVHDMVRQARNGGGWVDYKWAHPVTNQVLTKASYVQRVGDVTLACGIYKD
jgi:methyl-accepting chemotaxis protein